MFDILESCRWVVCEARHVRIDEGAVADRAGRIDPARLPSSEPPEPLRFRGDRDDCANFTLLCDGLNFCFWSERPWIVRYAGRAWTRTFAMLAGVHRAVSQDAGWLDPRRWCDATDADVRRMFCDEGGIPLVAERAHVLNETGDRLLTSYQGRFASLLERAEFDAAGVAGLLARDFPSFHDVADYDGRPVALLKRAQICASDVSALWSDQGYGALTGLERLTVFADYRLPQLFRHWGILRLSPTLEAQIQSREVIPAGSEAEVEIRAATVVIGHELSRAVGVAPYRLDYFLWEASHAPEVTIEHHRTPTIYY